MALYTGLQQPEQLGKIIVASGYALEKDGQMGLWLEKGGLMGVIVVLVLSENSFLLLISTCFPLTQPGKIPVSEAYKDKTEILWLVEGFVSM